VNTRTAILALVVALVVAGAGWVALRPKPAPPPPTKTWLASLDPLRVTSTRVTWADKQAVTLERSVVPGSWVLMPGSGGNGSGAPWPVAINQVRGALRLFADLDATPPSDGAPPAGGTDVMIKFEDGSEHTLTMSEASLGGKTLVVVHGPPDTIRMGDAGLSKMFQGRLLAWRQPSALCGSASDAPGDPSRIKLQSTGRQVTLGATLGKWGILAPEAAPADQATCAQLLQKLGALPVQKFIDESLPDTATGLSAPTAMIDVDTDFRIAKGAEVERRVLTQKVTVGGPADATGTKLYARLEATWKDPSKPGSLLAWSALAVLNQSDLAPITAESTAYLSKVSTQKLLADINGLVLMADDSAMQVKSPTAQPGARSVRLARTLDGWRYKPDSGEPKAPAPSAAAQIDALTHLLSEQPADAMGFEAPSGVKAIAMIEVQGGEGPAQQIGAGLAEVTPAGKSAQAALVLRAGPVFRAYLGKAAIDIAKWIAEELPPEG
jgi:hypothetical protein